MAIMYLSKENFICPIVQLSYTFEHSLKPDINSLVNSVDPDHMASEESS